MKGSLSPEDERCRFKTVTVAAVSRLFNYGFSAVFLSVFENTVYSTARSAERQRGAARCTVL